MPGLCASTKKSRKILGVRNLVFAVAAVLLTLSSREVGELPARAAEAVPEKAQDARMSINLEALSRLKGIDLESNLAVKAVVLKILEQVRGTPQFVEIVRDFKVRGQTDGLLEAAEKDPSGPMGAEAARLLLQQEDFATVKLSLNGTNAEAMIEALGNTGEKAAGPLLLPIVTDNAKSVSARKRAV